MISMMKLILVAGALVGVQTVAAPPAEAGDRSYTVSYRVACCGSSPHFGYYKTVQYWPAARAVNKGGYFRLVSYRAINVQRRR